MEYFDDFCSFGILGYGLVNKILFLEQSEHFDFWHLLLAQNVFGKTISQMQSEFAVVHLDF